jgi:hypothetical protein
MRCSIGTCFYRFGSSCGRTDARIAGFKRYVRLTELKLFGSDDQRARPYMSRRRTLDSLFWMI